MKRILFFCGLLGLLFCSSAQAALTYDTTYYVNNRAYLGSGGFNDPLYNMWNELETKLEAMTLESGTTITFANGGSFDNVVNNVFEWNENSDELKWTFGSNTVTMSSTDVTLFDLGTIVLGFDQFKVNATTYTFPTADGTNGQVIKTNGSGTLSWTANGGTFTGGNITSDCTLSDAVDLMSTTTTGEAATIKVYDNDTGPGYTNVLSWTNGNVPAIAVGSDTSTFALNSTTIDIAAGAVSGVTTLTASGAVTSGGLSSTGNISFGDDTGTFSVSSTGMDVSTAGAVSGVTTLSMTDDLSMANGKGVKSSTTSGQTVGVYGYDNDTGPSYVGALVITNGNTPATVLGNTNGTTAISSSDWAVSTTGAMTGIGAITMDGLLTGTAGATVTGAAVNLNASSNFAVNIGTGTNNQLVTIGGGSGTAAINTSDWDINAAGAATNIDSIAGNNGNTINLAINQRFEFTDNSETFGFDVGTTGNTVELLTDSGIDTIDCNDVDNFTDVETITGDQGVKVDLSMDERVEFKDGAESFGFLLSGANTITFTTDSGATLIDFNDVDQLTGVEYVNGDNGNKLDFSINQRFEFSDNSENFGFDVGTTSNTVELTTDSGITTVDFNDVDNLTDVESIQFDDSALSKIMCVTVELSNGDIKGLQGASKVLIGVPGADYAIIPMQLVLVLDYGSEVLTESADNLQLSWDNGTTAIGAAIEATNFIDAAADTITTWVNAGDEITATSLINNKNVTLDNTGDGEYGGNASNDTTMTATIYYRIIKLGL